MTKLVEAKYLRKEHLILDAVTKDVVFEGKDPKGMRSTNAAKRESRKLQTEGGKRLGNGIVRVLRA